MNDTNQTTRAPFKTRDQVLASVNFLHTVRETAELLGFHGEAKGLLSYYYGPSGSDQKLVRRTTSLSQRLQPVMDRFALKLPTVA